MSLLSRIFGKEDEIKTIHMSYFPNCDEIIREAEERERIEMSNIKSFADAKTLNHVCYLLKEEVRFSFNIMTYYCDDKVTRMEICKRFEHLDSLYEMLSIELAEQFGLTGTYDRNELMGIEIYNNGGEI